MKATANYTIAIEHACKPRPVYYSTCDAVYYLPENLSEVIDLAIRRLYTTSLLRVEPKG